MNILLKQQTMLVIRALYFCMEKRWAELEKKFKLTPAQQHILFLLGTHNQKLSPTQISELGCWHLSTVTRLLKPLKVKGLIEITANQEQLRCKCVTITKSGKELLNQIMDEVKRMEQFPLNMDELSENEHMSFLEYGQKILGIQKGDLFRQMLIDARVENYDYA
ncbi:MarR family transcriptional regulator [Cytobacillus firmus]|uniref:MarR family transcriptional regulator n=1 Tax=Cytobacillus firmus TaxID=1399 RepID=UPI0030020956